jgi:hypothetical protein
MSTTSSNVTSGFIDLATFDELEKYMYGGQDATAYFVRETRKATWFTQVPVVLSRAAGSPAFDTEWSVSISRAGDYLLNTWLRVTVPKITAKGAVEGATRYCRWTRNLMHNLIKEATITFNDLVAARFDNYHLDFWAAFTVPASKRAGYEDMIGNNGLELPNSSHDVTILNLPLPFFFCRDSGVALPTAALPYNDMRLNFSFRKWEDLVIVEDTIAGPPGQLNIIPTNTNSVDTTGTLPLAHVWANYAIVSNDERKRMACAPRDILIEQVQTAPRYTFVPYSNSKPSFDIRFSHAIKALFFAVRNTTIGSEWSNYTDRTIAHTTTHTALDPSDCKDPILETSLVYENTNRLTSMGADYFSRVNPWYHAPAIPTDKGYHMYSYSLDFFSLDPMGSTNYGKLTNVSIQPVATKDAYDLSNPAVTGETALFAGGQQKYEFVVTAVNNNVVRISGGALGFPVL